MTIYLALLRGINVGGKNIMKMPDLITCFQALGFTQVNTYIQSGNVIFSADQADQEDLTGRLQEALSAAFNYQSSVVLRSLEEMRLIVRQAPPGFGSQPETYHYDVVFLKKPLSAEEAIRQVTTRPGVDQAFAANGVLYFVKLLSRASQSYLPKIVGLPVYQSMTIRNWNTTNKLLSLMEEPAQ